jgi:hypothetical protein
VGAVIDEPRPIAEQLTDGSDMAAAALLVAIADDPDLIPHREDRPLLAQLDELGCLEMGVLTPLGRRVVVLLERMGIRARLD